MKIRTGTLTGLFLALALSALAQTKAPATGFSNTHHIKTVWVILMENHNWLKDKYAYRDIKNNAEAPYFNWSLLPNGAHAENYWNPPRNHPSLPNYLWLEAGTNFGVYADGSAYQFGQGTTFHLSRMLDNHGISWKAYDEATNGTTCPLTHWHNPFVFFHDETGNNNSHDARCIAHVRGMWELARDLSANTVARYNFIVPSNCHDMHTSCSGQNQIRQGDDWLRAHVPTILHSAAYHDGGAIFIVFDEAAYGDGPIPMMVISPFAKTGYSNTIRYNHGSMLRTMQEIFGVYPLMRDAAVQPDLRDLFSVFP